MELEKAVDVLSTRLAMLQNWCLERGWDVEGDMEWSRWATWMRVLEWDGIGRLIYKCVHWHEKCERICSTRHSSCKMRVQMGSLARLSTNLGLFCGGGSSFPRSCYRNTLGTLYFTLLHFTWLCAVQSPLFLSLKPIFPLAVIIVLFRWDGTRQMRKCGQIPPTPLLYKTADISI
jgi:hypothetical protein